MDLNAKPVGEAPHDPQAKPDAAARAAIVAAKLLELAEHVLQSALGHTYARVPHCNQDAFGIFGALEFNSAFVGIFDRIADQITQYLPKQHRIGGDGERGRIELQHEPALGGKGRHFDLHRPQQIPKRHVLDLERDIAGTDLGHVQQGVEHFRL